MTVITRAVEVALTIPDNEAETALATLFRLGVALEALERADLYRFEVDEAQQEALVATLLGLETIFNPNKHVMNVRADGAPQAGELWVEELHPGLPEGDADAPEGPVRIAGRLLPGVRRIERFTAWRLFESGRRPASPEVVARAAQTLLYNPAFQKALTTQ
jgi:phosphoribosylformylglycinamidine (FGAM) synthase PurS component